MKTQSAPATESAAAGGGFGGFIKRLLGSEGVKYILVGGSNTLISWVLTWLFTLILTSLAVDQDVIYWVVSLVCFAIGVTYSYLLNRKYTFKAADMPVSRTLPRFLLNVGVCYLLSYYLAKRYLDYKFAADWAVSWPEQYVTLVKLLAANVLYVVLNYVGQKFFAFKKPAGEPAAAAGGASAPESDRSSASGSGGENK